jgi:glycosyltransferase involved in cell wall biosynthesis
VKVLYFTLGFSPHDRRFLEALAETNHQIEYLPLLAGLSQEAIGTLPDSVPGNSALLNDHSLSWRRYMEAIARFRERVDQIQPDLIHAGPIHLSAAISALVGFHPLVSMSWGSDLLWESRKPWNNVLARFTLKRSDAFVGDCQAVERIAIKLGMDADRIILFPWGTDLDRFSPGSGARLRQELGWQDKFILISTRTFEPLYGVDVIVNAFIQAARRHRQLRLLLLGEGSQRSLFEKWLDGAGLSGRVHFAGRITRDELPEYYRAANLYLSASHSDGSSVSLLEAMACGLPALVSNIPGNQEWVVPGENGWLFRTGKADSLVESIEKALDERHRFNKIGMTARRIAESRADWYENFPELLDAYQIALNHHEGQAS